MASTLPDTVRYTDRYAKLHPKLVRATDGRPKGADRRAAAFAAYFALCGEEYVFYRAGRVPPDVWRAWCRVMLDWLGTAEGEAYWQAHRGRGSHYGLTAEAIRLGAFVAALPADG